MTLTGAGGIAGAVTIQYTPFIRHSNENDITLINDTIQKCFVVFTGYFDM
jgi:hypothetical protein